ncbi:hypothetical protein D1871_04490 [Nakamurella silvestris]|nr:hypothetical protein D1871_04490 [Nakamurella silvestris]
MSLYIAVIDWGTRWVAYHCPTVFTGPDLVAVKRQVAERIFATELYNTVIDAFKAEHPLDSADPAAVDAWLEVLREKRDEPSVIFRVADTAALTQVQEAVEVEAAVGESGTNATGPRDYAQALPAALAAIREDIAAGVIPADGTVEGWGCLADYTDHNLYLIEALFPGYGQSQDLGPDFNASCDELAAGVEAAIASGELEVGLTLPERTAIVGCIANGHRRCRETGRSCIPARAGSEGLAAAS